MEIFDVVGGAGRKTFRCRVGVFVVVVFVIVAAAGVGGVWCSLPRGLCSRVRF